MKQLLINSEGLENRVAVVEDGRLQDYFIERKDDHRLVGSVFKGVIRNLEPSLQAAFVDIGAEKNAFLHYWDMLPATQEMLEEGDDDGEEVDTVEEPVHDSRRARQAATRRGVLTAIRQRLFARKKEKAPPQGGRKGLRHAADVEDIPDLFPVNSEVVVQVTKGPIGNKGARVSTNISLPGRFLVLMPNSPHVGISKRIDNSKDRERLRQILRKLNLPKNMGLICRTMGAGKTEATFHEDYDLLLSSWRKAEQRIRDARAPSCIYEEPGLVARTMRDYLSEDVNEIAVDSAETHELAVEMAKQLHRDKRVKVRLYEGVQPLFDRYKLTQQIENIFGRRVGLASGGHLCIDETEALIAIDVNTSKSRGGKDHPETILSTNLEAAEEVARQLRLRNLGGLIIIDFIDMRDRADRTAVFKTLKDALEHDRAKTKACPISPLGLVEMTRQREHESLRDTVFSQCPYCKGKGLVKSSTSVSVEIQRRLQTLLRSRKKDQQIRVMVHPHVLARLKNEDAALLQSMEVEFGGELSFRSDGDLHLEEFQVMDLQSGRKL